MYFKLSFRNVKKSFKNYLLYFLTLAFAVCVFYVFNSVEAQQAMLNLSSSSQIVLKNMTNLIGMISVFVSFVLGFLIIFANNFLIRRRKKELGLYMTLGMNKGKIAKILIIETLIIGIFSLAAGLLVGIFASQWLSVFTAKLFEADMTKYVFIFSAKAFAKTIFYFSIIFIIAMIVSTFAISRYRLIDLINAEKQNEQVKLRSVPMTIILFILSICFLVTAYYMVIKNGLYNLDNTLTIEIILGSIGTFLFFASLSGFFLRIIQANKRRYFKGLNMFVLRQVNNRVNTAFISMSFICLMLFFTIAILSGGLGINTVMTATIKNSIPFDVTVISYNAGSVEKILHDEEIDLKDYTDETYEYQNFQIEDLNYSEILSKVEEYLPTDMRNRRMLMDTPINLIRLSDYNALMKKLGKKEISLSSDSIALYSDYALNSNILLNVIQKYIEQKNTLIINHQPYSVYPQILTDCISSSMGSDVISLIVPDEVVNQAKPVFSVLNFNCRADSSAVQLQFEKDTDKLKNSTLSGQISIFIKDVIKDSYTGTKALVSYIGIYLGLVFLISSAAILALQQLSEVADNRQRYTILKKIGADGKMIDHAIFKQILVYFSLPLALACIHSVVGLYVVNEMIKSLGDINVTANIAITAAMVLVVYGTYFLATYFGSRNMITRSEN